MARWPHVRADGAEKKSDYIYTHTCIVREKEKDPSFGFTFWTSEGLLSGFDSLQVTFVWFWFSFPITRNPLLLLYVFLV